MVASGTFTEFRGFRGTPGTPPGSAPVCFILDTYNVLNMLLAFVLLFVSDGRMSESGMFELGKRSCPFSHWPF